MDDLFAFWSQFIGPENGPWQLLIAWSQLQIIGLNFVFGELKLNHCAKAADVAFAEGLLKWRNKSVKQQVEMKWSQQQELGKQRQGKHLRH